MDHNTRIEDGSGFHLSSIDPGSSGGFKDRDDCEEATEALIENLRDLHERFYVDNRRALLIVLQAMDTGGKDGLIKSISSGVNPAGCSVTSFKAPTTLERGHDYLWRISNALPRKGTFGIHNRSHYEDVLVVRVHNLVPPEVWGRRYEHINAFERRLTDEGTLVIKFFLHISKDEQKKRLQERLDKPGKNWKFDPGDLKERKHWDAYQEAYQEAIRRCSTPHAPWHVIPANRKWYRNYAVASALVETLSALHMEYPKPTFDPKSIVLD